MRLSSNFGASRASRLDAVLQKKNRVPSNEKRELLKKRTVTACLPLPALAPRAEHPKSTTNNMKSDDAHRIKQSASSADLEITVETRKWNDEDQALIDSVLQNWNDAFFANHKEVRERLHYEIAQGPDGIEAKSGELQNILRFLKAEFEKLKNQKKDAQISTDTHDIIDDNAISSGIDTSINADQNYAWSPEEQELINWFTELRPEQLPSIPFLLSAGVTVVSSKFFDRIKLEIAAGASSPRSRTGALQYDLHALKKLIL